MLPAPTFLLCWQTGHHSADPVSSCPREGMPRQSGRALLKIVQNTEHLVRSFFEHGSIHFRFEHGSQNVAIMKP